MRRDRSLVPYKPRPLARREINRDLARQERKLEDLLPTNCGKLPMGDGDVGEAALRILRCSREAEVEADVPESTVLVELLTQTEVAAGELLETQHRGKVACKEGKWYFEQERER